MMRLILHDVAFLLIATWLNGFSAAAPSRLIQPFLNTWYESALRSDLFIRGDASSNLFRDGSAVRNSSHCQVLLVESIPENLTYSRDAPRHPSTFVAWSLLIDRAKTEISLASFYWSLLAEVPLNCTAAKQGQKIYSALHAKAKELKLRIAQDGPQVPNAELDELISAGAQVQWVDVARLLGRGVLHTKLWTIDNQHGYLGSANMDWRSLTEVKELGLLMLNCPELTLDLNKILGSYWLVGGPQGQLPKIWPSELTTPYNRTNPLLTKINGISAELYFTSSPPAFSPPGRNDDLDAILSTIAKARSFVFVSVMDYSPEIVSYDANSSYSFWPVIDNALRNAAIERGIEVRLLISRWRYTSVSMDRYLTSLRALNGIRGTKLRIRYFIVPSYTDEQKQLPHARVNHNKYMVTDNTAYIGTSNWSGDYFLFTGGAAFVAQEKEPEATPGDEFTFDAAKPKTIRRQLAEIFYRDWNSEYSQEL